eukprot:jgi/Hompol1/3879/HPOL_006799-RA
MDSSLIEDHHSDNELELAERLKQEQQVEHAAWDLERAGSDDEQYLKLPPPPQQHQQQKASDDCLEQDASYTNSDDRCSICLAIFEDKARLNLCLHGFCFECIKRWSAVSRQCPLCKRPFEFVIHHIASETDFTMHSFEPLQGHSGSTNGSSGSGNRTRAVSSQPTASLRFGQRSSRSILQQERHRRASLRRHQNDSQRRVMQREWGRSSSPSKLSLSMQSLGHDPAVVHRRRLIYQQGLRAKHMGTTLQSKVKEFRKSLV